MAKKLLKIYFLIIALGLLVFFIPIAKAEVSSGQSREIKSFYSEIEIKKDGKVFVQETINVVYNIPTHRIIRTIPINYKDQFGSNYSIRLNFAESTDEKGNIYKKEIIKDGKNIVIKVGDPDKELTGEHIYKISYEVERVIIFDRNGQDEFYWNVTGVDWPIPITNVLGKVILPAEINKSIEAYCWTGQLGSVKKNCQISTSKNIVNFRSSDFLTISVKFPTGIIERPTNLQKIGWFLADNWILLIPILVFIFMFLFWYFKGRDPGGRGTIIAEFEPPDDLRPTEVGLLYDNKIQTQDITATIVDLAVRGYLKIIEKKDKKYDLLLKKQFKDDKKLRSYEISILTDIFGEKEQVSLDDLKNKFYKYLSKIHDDIADNLVEKGYYNKNPVKVRKFWIGLVVSMGFIGFFAYIGLNQSFVGLNLSWLFIVSLAISVVIILVFGLKMTKRTSKGAETLEKIKGLRLYVDTAEKYRVKFQEKENIFEKFLPYAMIFGLADKWAKAFEGIYKEPPSWYSGHQGIFTTIYFVNSMNSFDSALSSSITTSPSSGTGGGGGGGFSGGGFGGGGGGFD